MKKERRMQFYPWRNLEHLKSIYSKYMSLNDIDTIINQVKKIGLFKSRGGATGEENERCLCNLINAIIMGILRKRRC
jgi:hypothetical protein